MNAEQPSPDVECTNEDILAPWFELEGTAINVKPSYFVVIQRVNWEKVPFARDTHLPPSQPKRLIKYSKAKWSPVSSCPAKTIQLARSSLYRELEPVNHSEWIRDELDSAFIAKLDWRKKGVSTMEFLKKRLRASLPGLEHTDSSIVVKFTAPGSWTYCTSIDPGSNSKRQIQKNHLALNYDFMTNIDNVPSFALQLGSDFGQQCEINNTFMVTLPKYSSLMSSITKKTIDNTLKNALAIEGISECTKKNLTNAVAQLKATPEAYTIHISHGAVAYLERDSIACLMAEIPDFDNAALLPFVKQIDYAEQQEYRFVISVQLHTPRIDKFNLAVSDELRTLMTPLGTAP